MCWMRFSSAVGVLDMRAAVQLGLHLPWMRRQQQDSRSDLDGLGNRMRHEQHRETRLVPQGQQFVLHLAARQRVECGERLVHQQYIRLHRHAARDRHALLHAAGQRMRIAVGEVREVDLVDVMHRAIFQLAPRQAAGGFERKHHVLLDRLPRQQLVELLEHHHAIRPGMLDQVSLQPDFALGRHHVAADRFEQGRFSAARRPEQNKSLRLEHLEVDSIRRRHQMVRRLVLQRDAFHLEQRSGRFHRFLIGE